MSYRQLQWMDPPSTGDLRRWGAPLNNGEREFELEQVARQVDSKLQPTG